jgi:hypothetical protein
MYFNLNLFSCSKFPQCCCRHCRYILEMPTFAFSKKISGFFLTYSHYPFSYLFLGTWWGQINIVWTVSNEYKEIQWIQIWGSSGPSNSSMSTHDLNRSLEIFVTKATHVLNDKFCWKKLDHLLLLLNRRIFLRLGILPIESLCKLEIRYQVIS